MKYFYLFQGSGKTTLLNFLAGRDLDFNIHCKGELYLNNERIITLKKYRKYIAYVM